MTLSVVKALSGIEAVALRFVWRWCRIWADYRRAANPVHFLPHIDGVVCRGNGFRELLNGFDDYLFGFRMPQSGAFLAIESVNGIAESMRLFELRSKEEIAPEMPAHLFQFTGAIA